MFHVWQRPRVESRSRGRSLPTHRCHLILAFAVDDQKMSGFLVDVMVVLPYSIPPKTSSHLHCKGYVLETCAPNHTMLCSTSFLCTKRPLETVDGPLSLYGWKPGISLMVDTCWPVAMPFDTKKARDLVVII